MNIEDVKIDQLVWCEGVLRRVSGISQKTYGLFLLNEYVNGIKLFHCSILEPYRGRDMIFQGDTY